MKYSDSARVFAAKRWLCLSILAFLTTGGESAAQSNAPTKEPRKPTSWPNIRGPWVLVLPDKRVFIKRDSTFVVRGDTISVLERIDIRDDYTTVEHYLLACKTHSIKAKWMRFFWKGRKPEYTSMEADFPNWERTTERVVAPFPGETVGSYSTPWRAEMAMCSMLGVNP